MTATQQANLRPFNAESSRIAAQKSAEVRKANRQARALLRLERGLVPAGSQAASQREPESYQDERLDRVRKQLDLIDRKITAALREPEIDAQQIDKLAAASARLNEQEAQLSMRAKPAPIKAGRNAAAAPAHAEPSVE